MAANGVLSDVKVAYSLASPVSWTQVPQVLDCTVPTFSREKVDTSVHGTKKYKKSIPGWNNVSDMTMKLLADFDETTTPSHAALAQLNIDGTTIWWRIEIATDAASTKWKAWEFQGYVGDFKPVTGVGAREEIDVTVPFNGDSFTAYAAGASAIS